jgi:hypothetical protein
MIGPAIIHNLGVVLAVTPEQFAVETKAWIEAGATVLDLLIVKIGILAIAFYGLLKVFRTQDAALKSEIQAMKERQDRQGNRIDQVALAVPPIGVPDNGNTQPDQEP